VVINQSSPSYSGLRILHTESAEGLGGQELRVLQEVLGMRQRGHQVYLAAPPKSLLAARAQKQGIPFIPMRQALWRWGLMIYQYMKIFVGYDIEIVNTHGSIDSWTAAIAGRLSKRQPLIIRSRHKSTPVTASVRHRWLYAKLPHAVITTGEMVRHGLIENCGVKESHIFSIPTGVDLKNFYPREPDRELKKKLGIPDGNQVVGSVAFLRAYKGVDVFLRAIASLEKENPHVTYLIIGSGEERETLECLASDLRLASQVCFLGFRNDIPHLLSIMDVVVLSSIDAEGIPQVLTQALAMERPVVATRVGGIPEIIRNQETGILVSPCDPTQIGLAIQQLLKDPAKGKKFGKAGHAVIREHFSYEKMLDRTEAVYQTVLQKASRSGDDKNSS